MLYKLKKDTAKNQFLSSLQSKILGRKYLVKVCANACERGAWPRETLKF